MLFCKVYDVKIQFGFYKIDATYYRYDNRKILNFIIKYTSNIIYKSIYNN